MYSKEDFGKDLMKEVRDRTIRQYNKTIKGLMKAEDDQALFRRYESLDDNAKGLIKDLIPLIVDTSLHFTLCMIEDSDDFTLCIGEDDIRDLSDGLAGELYGNEGWIAKYSSDNNS